MSRIADCSQYTFVFPSVSSHSETTDRSRSLLSAQRYSRATVVAVNGEIDASNADPMSTDVADFISSGRPLVLDLSGVDFFGVAGFRALMKVADEFTMAGLNWALVTGDAVELVLRVAHRNYLFPRAASMDEALQRLTGSARAKSVTPAHFTRC
jgi:anti-anti-sigma factor